MIKRWKSADVYMDRSECNWCLHNQSHLKGNMTLALLSTPKPATSVSRSLHICRALWAEAWSPTETDSRPASATNIMDIRREGVDRGSFRP